MRGARKIDYVPREGNAKYYWEGNDMVMLPDRQTQVDLLTVRVDALEKCVERLSNRPILTARVESAEARITYLETQLNRLCDVLLDRFGPEEIK